MERVYFMAPTADHYSDELKAKVVEFNSRAGAWQREREQTEPAAVTADTFVTVEDAMQAVTAIRRARFEMPLTGLALLRELEAIRTAAGDAWRQRKAGLDAALAAAVKKAEAEAATFAGLSASARAAHVADKTTEEQAAAWAEDPTPASFIHWNEATIKRGRAILETEFAAAFAAAIR
jgi:hypothetical protein